MIKFALFVRLQAKPGKAQDVADFISGALPLAVAEPDTSTWYALQFDETTFGIFDTFPHEEGREAHLAGKIAAALMENAPDLLASPPSIEKVSILAAKTVND